MNLRIIFLFLTLFFGNHYTAIAKTIKTVVSNGMGTSVQLAAQNAAENALTQVVGSFMDAETQLKKRTEIRDGVVAKTKTISKDIKDYSQGTIKYFEIIEAKETSGIFKVTARVDVRIDDFKAYIKKLASGEQKVGAGLFGVMKSAKDDEVNQASLLVDKIFLPVVAGEVHDIVVGDPMPAKLFFEDICSSGKFKTSIGSFSNGCNTVEDRIRDISMTVAIPFTISLKSEFWENTINIMNNISDARKEMVLPDKEIYHLNKAIYGTGLLKAGIGLNLVKPGGNGTSTSSVGYSINKMKNLISNHLFTGDSGSYGKKIKKKYATLFVDSRSPYSITRPNIKHYGCVAHNDLWFSIYDGNKNLLTREVFETCHSEKTVKRNRWLSIMGKEQFVPALSLYASQVSQFSSPILMSKRSYMLLITLDENLLSKAASMKIEYSQS